MPTPISAPITASTSQIHIHARCVAARAARYAAGKAVRPMMAPPHPDSAVNDAAPSIVSRM